MEENGKENKLIFEDAEKARDAITESQKKEIARLYQQWADEIGERANYYTHKSTTSSVVSWRQMKELQKQLTESSHQVSNEIYKGIKQSIYTVSDAVVKDNVDWLKKFGFSEDGLNAAFSSVPDNIVKMLVTGQIYEGGWNLSSRIWGNNEKILSNCYEIIAKGMAENKPIYNITKELEKYVSPKTAKSWNPIIKTKNTKTGEWEYKRIYRGKVDYNAQRLARTLVQHGYQQSFIAVTEKNPFVLKYVWYANGSRPCPLCMDRDGQEFEKGNLPMDHPNGQCTMAPVVDDKMIDKLVDWFNSPDGTYPEIDEYAKGFGYKPTPLPKQTETQSKWFSAAGYKDGKMPKDFTEFAYKLNYEQQTALLKEAGGNWGDAHPFQKMEAYYNANIAKAGKAQATVVSVGDISSLGTSKGKTFNYWYTKLDDTQKALAKELKEKSGLTWQQWYEQNIYTGGKLTKVAQVEQQGSIVFDKVKWQSMFDSQTTREMLNNEKEVFGKMTTAQINAIETYSGSSYNKINGYLRNMAGGMSEEDAIAASKISGNELKVTKDISAGLAKVSTEKPYVVYRGTDLGELAGFMKGDFNANKQALRQMSVQDLADKFNSTTGKYAGYTSTCSVNDKDQWSDSMFRGGRGSVEMAIYVPKGTSASSIMEISQYGTSEGEFLLNAGTNIYIHEVEETAKGKIRVWAEVVK